MIWKSLFSAVAILAHILPALAAPALDSELSSHLNASFRGLFADYIVHRQLYYSQNIYYTTLYFPKRLYWYFTCLALFVWSLMRLGKYNVV
jgi:hypothetical protein